MTIHHKLAGGPMQMVVCQLDPDQSMYCEPGRFLWKTSNVAVEARVWPPEVPAPAPAPAPGGRLLQKARATASEVSKRIRAGETITLQSFRPAGGSGLVAFAGLVPGAVRVLELDGDAGGGGWLAERDAFVAAEGTVVVGLEASTGTRDGRPLARFGGTGTLVVAGAGELIDLDPADYGGTIQVDTGCVVAFRDSLTYRVDRVASRNGAFGTEGLTLLTLEGEGEVILQSMTFDGLARAVGRRRGSDGRGDSM